MVPLHLLVAKIREAWYNGATRTQLNIDKKKNLCEITERTGAYRALLILIRV